MTKALDASQAPAPAATGAGALPRWLPGLGLVLVVALVARFIGRYTGIVPDVVIALAIGIAIRNIVKPAGIEAGTKFTLFYVLRTAIILLGAGLSIQAVIATGSSTLLLVVTLVIVSMLLGLALARLFRLKGTIGTLIGAGTAICGGSAILTVGPILGAAEEEIAYAITTIFAFNIVALLAYPAIGHALGMTQTAFGSWAGTAVNDTSVVVATGLVYGTTAGAVATIVKLTRTVLLVPLAVAVGLVNAARSGKGDASSSVVQRAVKATPWFILGFVAMAVLNSLGAFSPQVGAALKVIASFLIVMVLAGVGLNVDVRKMVRLGPRPMLVGFLLATIMAFCSYGLVGALGIH
ncbi:MAG: putative sulfate exporter family transporter [Candidatus Eremiobacteraeota bacterium]|nr:putative sulfate exporter family transporter [Candidatus Eremiobacteraeota bacterium]